MDNAQTERGLQRFVEQRTIIVRFMQDHLRRSGASGYVVGLSGGVDSALTAALAVEAVGAANVHGVALPHEHSDPIDARLAAAVASHLGIACDTIDITPITEGFRAGLEDQSLQANAKARARMMVLYGVAQSKGYLVAGTGNKTELLIGYFTKYGDGGVDLEPIGDLYKTEVWEMARAFGLPSEVVERTPTAGLIDGQTDEDELGISYARLDPILKGIELNASAESIMRKTGSTREEVELVDGLVRRSEHKRHAPLVPKLGARTVGIDWRRSVHWD